MHKLIYTWGFKKDFETFYKIQAVDTADWLSKSELVDFGSKPTVLDLGCGTGTMGVEFEKRGCNVTFADVENSLYSTVDGRNFTIFDIEKDDYSKLGKYDLVLSSNVLEHLPNRRRFLKNVGELLNPGGVFYLSFTNWLSPWGGHEFSPFHYFGPGFGPFLWDKLVKKKRVHEPGINLFPTHIGEVFHWIQNDKVLKIQKKFHDFTQSFHYW